jgi:hypothetical protein
LLTGRVALAIDGNEERVPNPYENFGVLRLLDDPLKLISPEDYKGCFSIRLPKNL